MSVLVAVPVLNRPRRAQELAASLEASRGQVPLRLLFLCSPDDRAEILACKRTGAEHHVVPFAAGEGDYARKINHSLGLLETDEQWIFTGADDLHFHPQWADFALLCSQRHGSRVIGTNDLGNPAVRRGHHSTHTLVHRDYAADGGTIDQPGLIYHEGYTHNWCDVEMIETAKSRREFIFCARSVVEHLHPHWRKAEMDTTYEAGLASFSQDRKLYSRRRRMWVGGRRYSRSRML